jgi:hypothetical protein
VRGHEGNLVSTFVFLGALRGENLLIHQRRNAGQFFPFQEFQ